jgi:toxin YoeB
MGHAALIRLGARCLFWLVPRRPGFWLGLFGGGPSATSDRKTGRRIVRLIAEIQRDPFSGIDKPEPLKGGLSGYWSRRIDDQHRLVYRAGDKEIKVLRRDIATFSNDR